MFKVDKASEILDKINDHDKLNYHVLESMADWVRVINKEGEIIYANKVMKEVLGDDIVGKKCSVDCIQDSPCCFCIVERSIYAGEVIQKEEIINGSYYSVKSSPVRDNNGEIIAAVEVFRDTTRERQLEFKLLDKNEKMSHDLEIAKRIQEKILPQAGPIGSLCFDYIYRPSEMLSGDMFDIFHIDEDNIGIYISDVAGHGVAASMMTMFIRQTMRFIKDEIVSPSIALSELHRRFCTLDLEMDKYFTMFYGVFNKSTYEFKFANAGHNSIPLKYNGSEIEELEISGYPISLLFDTITYKEGKIKLDKKDKIFLYTDGLIEIRGSNNQEFGVENLKKIIINSKEDVLKAVDEEVIKFSQGQQDDDYALLSLEVTR